ncbi:hypothetical protein BGZ65_006288 [Modicella reniformis]|uniref:Fucosyltransferase n=1 Tax=Modicella reniformis TaxID=1440133 RepID=A0A9P6M8H0_9FUNG|nr:hypothetical protein BGZ65_006288 [Modicella reniformis]
MVALKAVTQGLEYGLYVFSFSNRTSTRWRLVLALALWLSYVVPVIISNESRYFNPARSALSFDIQHPEPLCSVRHMNGSEARHDSFEGYWNEYLAFHHRMILPQEKGGIPQEQKRFLIFQPSDDGLGNRLQGLLSSVVLAMVTQRAIILDWQATPQCNASFTDLFQQPDNLVWDLNTTLPNYEEQQAYQARYQLWYAYCRSCAIRSPITPNTPWSSLLCDSDLGIYDTSSIVQVISTHWYLPVIQHNPHWRQELCHMFPEGGKNAFEILGKKLLRPSQAVQQMIDSVMERVPDDVTLIGLQVRRTENNAVGSGIEDSFLSCAAEVMEEEEDKFLEAWRTGSLLARERLTAQRLLRNKKGLSISSRTGYEESTIVQRGRTWMRDDIKRSSRPSKPKFAYYLATDYRPTRTHFQKVLGDRLFVLENTFLPHKSSAPSSNVPGTKLSGTIEFSLPDVSDDTSRASRPSHPFASTSPSSSSSFITHTEAVVRRNSVQGVQIAVAEMLLLAQSDRIIFSPYSTFGYFAHAFANVQPNIVKRDGTCIKRRSTQPCFQYWFGFANGGTTCNIRSTTEMSEDYDCWL